MQNISSITNVIHFRNTQLTVVKNSEYSRINGDITNN
jgi:hypothetical protein